MYGALPAPPATGAVLAFGVAPLLGWSFFDAAVAMGLALGVWSLYRASRLKGRFGQ